MSEPAWWQRGAIYQIYPRSFADSNGDGVGDLKGITSRLDYLQELAVEAIWLSPIFTSPMADFGYDVADYRDVDPIFGTLQDLDELIAECHARDIKVVLDWVPNHTSNQHPWFQESKSSRDNPKRDWYVWRDQPNDWVSQFKAVGPSWTYDETTGSTTCTASWPSSPTSTGTTPRSWRRCTTCCGSGWTAASTACAWTRSTRSPRTRCSETTPRRSRRHDQDWESIHDRLRGIRKVIDEYDDRMIVGEVALEDLHRIVAYLGYGDQLHLAHNFVFIDQEWDAETYATSIADFERLAEHTALAGLVPRQPRQAAPRQPLQPRRPRPERARAILVMLYALRGTPFIYQGEELGLPDAHIPPERIVDVDGRDPERAPIPWTPGRTEPRFHHRQPRGCHSSPKLTPSMQEPKPRIRAQR